MKPIPILTIFLLLWSCQMKPGKFQSTSVPSEPDYGNLYFWAAHPDKGDPADRTPGPNFPDNQDSARADVFFLHPTTFYTRRTDSWNADLQDAALNEQTDETTILLQASVFNAAGRVFAPRYRQAHLRSFFTEDTLSAKRALELAYIDLESAFRYYLDHWNEGRPIIIAAHSQGSLHAIQILKKFFDGKPLANQLIAAYIVGWSVENDTFESIPVCNSPEQTGCFVSWRSFKEGYVPKKYPLGDSIAVVNPLLWTTSRERAPKELNEGMVLRKLDQVFPGRADAKIERGILWVNKPKFPGSIFFRRKNYHIADYNLFYMNIRKNAVERVATFFRARSN